MPVRKLSKKAESTGFTVLRWHGPRLFDEDPIIPFSKTWNEPINMTPTIQKIKTLDRAREERQNQKRSGRQVVFTNGCFDILHPGHVRYLSAARNLGDFLIVAINSDRSVRAIKGGKRPILGENSRAETMAALQCVDLVLIFDEDNPLTVIELLLPDILVKGGDWAEDQIIGAETVRQNRGRVISLPFETGFSTTGIIEEILKKYPCPSRNGSAMST